MWMAKILALSAWEMWVLQLNIPHGEWSFLVIRWLADWLTEELWRDFDLHARPCFTHNALSRIETHMLPSTGADINTHVYTLVYEHHTVRNTLIGSQINAGTHKLAHASRMWHLSNKHLCPRLKRSHHQCWPTVLFWGKIGALRNTELQLWYRFFYCGKICSGPAGIYLQKISGDAKHKTW